MNAYSIQIDPVLAREAQTVLQGLGTDIPAAVNMFLRQTVLNRAIPFQAQDPTLFTEAELMAKHQRGIEAIEAGRGICVTMEQLEAMANDKRTSGAFP